MPPGECASFRLRTDARGRSPVLAGEAALHTPCGPHRTFARVLEALGTALSPSQGLARYAFEPPTGTPQPIFVALSIRPDEDGRLSEGRANWLCRAAEPRTARVPEIGAFAARRIPGDHTRPKSEREMAVLGQLKMLPELAVARLPGALEVSHAAHSAFRRSCGVIEPVLPVDARATDPLQLRLWRPLGSNGAACRRLQLVLKPAVRPFDWLMDLCAGYADRRALVPAHGGGDGVAAPAPPTRLPARPCKVPLPQEPKLRRRDLVQRLVAGVAGMRELAARRGVFRPTVKVPWLFFLRRLGVGGHSQLVPSAVAEWTEWLCRERQRELT